MNEQSIIIDEGSMMVDFASSNIEDKSVIVLVSGDERFLMCYDVKSLQNVELLPFQKELFEKIVKGDFCSFSMENKSEKLLDEITENLTINLNNNEEGNWRKKRFYD